MAAVAAEAAEEPLWGQVVGVQPGLTTTAPEVVQGVITEQPGANAGTRGSIESLGRWNEKRDDRAMPHKMGGDVRVAFGKFVDELVQTKGASSGILAISNWKEMLGPPRIFSEFSWSASGTSYQRHGAPDEAARLRAEAKKKGKEPLKIRFADFEGVVDDFGDEDQMAVYRVTLPSGGLDADKWSGRPPPPAPEDLYTGPRRDGLLSTGEISGDYSLCYFPIIGHSMTVVPHGPDMIETWRLCWFVLPPLIWPIAQGGVRTRDPGTNTFRYPQSQDPNKIVTFSADGTAEQGCDIFKKRPDSQKRAFQKVETRDLAGNWRGCCCPLFMLLWPFSGISCTTKKALNEDQYSESVRCCVLGVPCPVETTTRTRKYVNGHPTNGFDGTWYRDPGCAAQLPHTYAKKVG